MSIQPAGGRTYTFGITDRLRIAREQAGLGQREFAEASGISRGTVGNYENGTTKPKRPQLIAWAMATGFSVEWLETGEEPSGRGPNGSDGARVQELPRLDSNQQPCGDRVRRIAGAPLAFAA